MLRLPYRKLLRRHHGWLLLPLDILNNGDFREKIGVDKDLRSITVHSADRCQQKNATREWKVESRLRGGAVEMRRKFLAVKARLATGVRSVFVSFAFVSFGSAHRKRLTAQG